MKTRLSRWFLIVGLSLVSSLAVITKVGLDKIYRNYDGIYYVVVAKTWYDKPLIGKSFDIPLPLEYYAAHFPLYPLLIDGLSVFKLNHLQSMVGVNLLATAICAVVIYEIWEKMKWKNPWWAVLTWLFWWPRMWGVRSIGSPETLFILEIILSLYWFCQKKYWLAGIAGAAAVATKSPGILLLPTYGIWAIEEWIKTKKLPWRIFPVILVGLALLGIFLLFGQRMGDFWAYFHSGDNIHLQALPFGVFNSEQPWVGTWWLDDVIWMYLIGAIGVWRAFAKNRVWGWFGVVFGTVILFVAHRDVTRYALPIVPVVILGLSELWDRKEVRIVMALATIPLFFYTVNFLTHNIAPISTLVRYF